MKRFRYKAKDKKGILITGEVEASSVEQAARLIKQKGLLIISIVPFRLDILSFLNQLKDRITQADVANFTRQLATMVNAGIPITESLLILRSQSKGVKQRMFAQILADVEGGDSFSTALSRFPKVFSSTYIALTKSGELGGVMDQVLARLGDNLEKDQEFKGKVKGALVYPVIVIVGMILVAFVMMIFVIPKMLALYSEFDAKLPVPTRILISVSGLLLKFWPIMLLVLGLSIWGLVLYRRTPSGRLKTDQVLLKIPIIGDLQRQVIMTELTRTLSLMISCGVSILEGLGIAAGVVGNRVMSDALKDSAKLVEKGFPVSYSFAKHPEAFPFILSQMIAVGEETGKMDEVLSKVSHVFEIESDQKVKALTSAVEPVIMVILGIGVGFLVIAVIMPIYSLTSQF